MSAPSWPVRIRLAKDPLRIAAVIALRGIVGGLGLWTGWVTTGVIGTVVLAAGALVTAYALVLAAWAVSVHIEVRPGQVELDWWLRRNRHALARGHITRLRPARRGTGRLRAPFHTLGLQLGPGRLGPVEHLTILRLARDATLITIPTEVGRLALAPANPQALVNALLAATGG